MHVRKFEFKIPTESVSYNCVNNSEHSVHCNFKRTEHAQLAFTL